MKLNDTKREIIGNLLTIIFIARIIFNPGWVFGLIPERVPLYKVIELFRKNYLIPFLFVHFLLIVFSRGLLRKKDIPIVGLLTTTSFYTGFITYFSYFFLTKFSEYTRYYLMWIIPNYLLIIFIYVTLYEEFANIMRKFFKYDFLIILLLISLFLFCFYSIFLGLCQVYKNL